MRSSWWFFGHHTRRDVQRTTSQCPSPVVDIIARVRMLGMRIWSKQSRDEGHIDIVVLLGNYWLME